MLVIPFGGFESLTATFRGLFLANFPRNGFETDDSMAEAVIECTQLIALPMTFALDILQLICP
jgi:hypothetical protein